MSRKLADESAIFCVGTVKLFRVNELLKMQVAYV